MKLRHLGYACINRTLGTKSRTFRLDNLRTEKVIPVVSQNLDNVLRMLRWNLEQGLPFFRITSDLIPFATHPDFPFDWREAFAWKFKEIRLLVKAEDLRVTSHPGQYTVLNSDKERVVEESIRELEHQAEVLRLIDPYTGTMTLHLGGAYGDKPSAKARFKENFARLSDEAKGRLILENDDTTYHLDDVLEVCEALEVPLVFDFFHHKCLHTGEGYRDGLVEKLERAMKLWGRKVPKLHLSSPRPGDGSPTAHADYVRPEDLDELVAVMESVGGDGPYDLMLEAKEKERAALELQGYLRTGLRPARNPVAA